MSDELALQYEIKYGIISAENGLRLTVHTIYGGFGVVGQDLGHGVFDTEFIVVEGDIFYEESDGHWLQNVSKTSALILSIEKIEADTVTVSVQSDSDGSSTKKRSRSVRTQTASCVRIMRCLTASAFIMSYALSAS